MKHKSFSTHPVELRHPAREVYTTAKGERVALIDHGGVRGEVRQHGKRTLFVRRQSDEKKETMRTEIKTTQDLKNALRHGAYAWPGGYPLYFITSDGGALNFSTVLEEIESVIDSIRGNHRDGWHVVAVEVNWENDELTDDHTGQRIESAYGKD